MASGIRNIVAGVRPLHRDDPILMPALQAAMSPGAELHLIHAFRLPDPLLDASTPMGLIDSDELRKRRLQAPGPEEPWTTR